MALSSFVTAPLFLQLVFSLGLYPGLEMGVVKRRSSDTALRFFYHAVPPLVFTQGWKMEVVKDNLLLLVISWMLVVLRVKGSGLPRRLVQAHLLMSIRIQGTQRRGDGKDCAPLLPKERRVRWACLAIFFLALGLGEVCTGDAWNLPSEGTGVVGFRLVSPAEGTSALALVHFN